jgi:hypothetical protein
LWPELHSGDSGQPRRGTGPATCTQAYANKEGPVKQVQSLHHNLKIATASELLKGMYSDGDTGRLRHDVGPPACTQAYADEDGPMKQVQSLHHNLKTATALELLKGMYSDGQSVAITEPYCCYKRHRHK